MVRVRSARRVPMGIARLGGVASNGSGDIFIAFSTANPGAAAERGETPISWLPNGDLTPYFEATVEATEEAIVNAMVAAETMVGINGNTVPALPIDQLPSYGLAVRHAGSGRSGRHLDRLETLLRRLPVPVIGRIADDALWLDLRCLEARDEADFSAQLAEPLA